MSSIYSIFENFEYSKLEKIPSKKTSRKKIKVLIDVIIINRKKIDFKLYIDGIYNLFKDFGSKNYRIIFLDFSQNTDFSYFFSSSLKNIEIFIFYKDLDLFNIIRFTREIAKIESEYHFIITTDYFPIKFDIIEVLKLFTEDTLGGVTFSIFRDKNLIKSYRYRFDVDPNKNYELNIEPVKSVKITTFPFDFAFFIRNNYFEILKIDILKQYINAKDKYPFDLNLRILSGFLYTFLKKYFIIYPDFMLEYTGTQGIEDRITFSSQNILRMFIKTHFLKKSTIYESTYLAIYLRSIIHDKMVYKEILKNIQSDIIQLNNQTQKKEDFIHKLFYLFEKY